MPQVKLAYPKFAHNTFEEAPPEPPIKLSKKETQEPLLVARGRQTEATPASKGQPRTAPPDWEVLFPANDEFLPDESHFCTRCLRKVPKKIMDGPKHDGGISVSHPNTLFFDMFMWIRSIANMFNSFTPTLGCHAKLVWPLASVILAVSGCQTDPAL